MSLFGNIRLISLVLFRRKNMNIITCFKRYISSANDLLKKAPLLGKEKLTSKCSTENSNSSSNLSDSTSKKPKEEENDEDDMEEMFVAGPGPNKDIEWGYV